MLREHPITNESRSSRDKENSDGFENSTSKMLDKNGAYSIYLMGLDQM